MAPARRRSSTSLNGFVPPNAGSIRFDGAEISGLRPNGVCRHGIGRTFQVARAFPRMSVLENVVVGAYAGAKTDAEAMDLALAALSARRAGAGRA